MADVVLTKEDEKKRSKPKDSSDVCPNNSKKPESKRG
jgi:hypothetical protein